VREEKHLRFDQPGPRCHPAAIPICRSACVALCASTPTLVRTKRQLALWVDAPVFVLTHYQREPLVMEGGTTFHFVTDGIVSALAQAQAVPGDGNVAITGGASTVNQYLVAGLLDELRLHITPFTFGTGTRVFDDLLDGLAPVASNAGPELDVLAREEKHGCTLALLTRHDRPRRGGGRDPVAVAVGPLPDARFARRVLIERSRRR
jgi:dihydrofolate reductase